MAISLTIFSGSENYPVLGKVMKEGEGWHTRVHRRMWQKVEHQYSGRATQSYRDVLQWYQLPPATGMLHFL